MVQGISIHIGLNGLDQNHYAGWQGILNACEKDARDMQGIAKRMGYVNTDLLLTKDATIKAVTSKIEDAAKNLKANDILLLTYSGHGAYITDYNNDEEDGRDETWCLYDGQLIDDQLHDLWANFAPGVRILVVSDSCHSGTIINLRIMSEFLSFFEKMPGNNNILMRFMPRHIADQVYKNNKEFYEAIRKKIPPKKRKINASVLSLTACQDNQVAEDGKKNGKFTATLLQVWDNDKFKGDYKSFHRKIVERMPPYQTPNLLAIGDNTDNFLTRRPFEI
jgi:hypothetical protein